MNDHNPAPLRLLLRVFYLIIFLAQGFSIGHAVFSLLLEEERWLATLLIQSSQREDPFRLREESTV